MGRLPAVEPKQSCHHPHQIQSQVQRAVAGQHVETGANRQEGHAHLDWYVRMSSSRAVRLLLLFNVGNAMGSPLEHLHKTMSCCSCCGVFFGNVAAVYSYPAMVMAAAITKEWYLQPKKLILHCFFPQHPVCVISAVRGIDFLFLCLRTHRPKLCVRPSEGPRVHSRRRHHWLGAHHRLDAKTGQHTCPSAWVEAAKEWPLFLLHIRVPVRRVQ